MKRISKSDIRIYRTAYGKIGLLVGLPVLAVGIYFALAGFGVLPLPGTPEDLNAPRRVVGAAGLSFVLAAGVLLVNTFRGLWHRHRAGIMRKRYPDRPWLADYHWDPNGIGDEAGRRPGYNLVAVVVLGVFLVPFNWWAFFSGDSAFMVKAVVSLFDFIWLLAFATLCYRLLQWAKYGNSRLIFATFPFAPGERLRVAFSPNRFTRLQATLRYVEERFEAEGSGEDRSVHHYSYEYYAEQKTIEVTDHDLRVLVEFDLPENPEWTTRMTADPAIRYWELVVDSALPGIDFHTSFPLPVYANPGSRYENPLFASLAEPRRGMARYRFELGLALLVAMLVVIPALVRPQLTGQVADWARATWHRTMLSHALEPLADIHGDVMNVSVGPDGAVWVLSKYALNRFERVGSDYRKTLLLDSEKYRKLFAGNLDSLSAVLPLAADEAVAGGWYGQLLFYRNGRWEEAGSRENPIKGRILNLLLHGETIYIGTKGGLWAWSGRPDAAPEIVSGVPRSETPALARSKGDLLAGIGREVWRLRQGEWRRHATLPDDLGDVAVIHPAKDGGLWVGAYGGLALLDAGGKLLGRELSGAQVTTLYENGGRLWAGTWNRGVARRERNEWVIAGTDQGLPGENLTSLAVDPSGTLWLGLYGKGLAHIAESDMLRRCAQVR